jgi:CHAT domain-containing protein
VLDARAGQGARITALVAPEVDARSAALARLDDQTRGQIARPLPSARTEGRHLAEAGATVLAGRQATLQRLEAGTPAAVLHFATHAVEDARVAPRGGLLLAGTPALLTPSAVESLGVTADLVSLSACRTLGGTTYRGEGAFGLTRAFLAAGARSVVTTRWDVGDRAAARAMELFYDGLRAGLARDESLGRAVRQLGREGFGARDRWAFLLVGVGDAPLPLAGRTRAAAK